MLHQDRVSSTRRTGRNAVRRISRAVVEALEDRRLLSVAFKFNIIDPTNQIKSIRPQLQTLLDAAGGEWAQYLDVPSFDVTLEYDVAISNEILPGTDLEIMRGAPKSAQVVDTDTDTGMDVLRVGTVTEMVTGTDPNGSTADAGITLFAKYIKKFWMDPQLNKRNDPIPVGSVDGYSVILHEIAHTLGFLSARDENGEFPSGQMYLYDQKVQGFGPIGSFGTGSGTFDPDTGIFLPDEGSDNAFKVYGQSVPLEFGNYSHLGTGTFDDFIRQNPALFFPPDFLETDLFDDLRADLMGGLVLPGERKTISKLDLAILKDSGTPTRINTTVNPIGIYEVNGTGFGDVIDVTQTNGTLLIRVNGESHSFEPLAANLLTAIVINGFAGNDIITLHDNVPAVAINGGAGNDEITGGPRGDSIQGAGGNDLIFGGAGSDVIRGGGGKDILYGQGGSDRIFGDANADHIDGGLQTDRVFGGSGNDTVIGGTEDDFLFGDAGNDLLNGAAGKDRLDGGSGADIFYGGSGNDSADYSTRTRGVLVTIDTNAGDGEPNEGDNVVDVENVIGSSFNDTVVGSDGPNSLIGGAGNDYLEGNGGNDTLEGNGGSDRLFGNGGNDSLLGGTSGDRLDGGSGRDFLFGDIGNDTFISNDGEIDTVQGTDGIDQSVSDGTDILDAIETPNIVAPKRRA